MDLNFTAEESAFRQQVRSFMQEKLPADIRRKVLGGMIVERDDYVRWQRVLHEQGWGAPGWPQQFGGPGWNATQQYIFEEESAAAGAPRAIPFGLKMVAPVIMAFGSPEQQQRYLPKILSAEEWWCQGYSEPGAGSDLASLKMRAAREGNEYVLNGQKTWTTLGQYADWIFCLVRTDPDVKPQRGISFILVRMDTPGITVRPIITMDGAHEVNEVYFENVRVPAENLIGEENKGWTYAKFLLGHERTNIAGIGIAKRELARLKRVASEEKKNGKPLLQDPMFAVRVAQVEADLTALEITNLRVLSAEAEHRAPGPEASILKIKGTEIQQAITELLTQAVGPYALQLNRAAMAAGYQGEHAGPAYAEPLAAGYLNMRKLSIYGGSNEIQKNIISQMILGL
ncbi:acyl-CoA dehydrogenase family protein [Noviherbaspirillum suwonense]|jgi:alkylation response protein AidB-like acyl-CoA dehydrogenase|uniref:Acyl-CoA dehydrogenase n=1 Tax=Noviherbaspirillum suwonense TaxID=1224511 RepID=A0ABY1PVW7_9BURK|nr:acyl-CoA dehydrogenase family protein [Noviherbaspirillum suwonense]SMP43795.1 Acyl-CoA dehydrogenase [Noviherbaspirillum suwonense]